MTTPLDNQKFAIYDTLLGRYVSPTFNTRQDANRYFAETVEYPDSNRHLKIIPIR